MAERMRVGTVVYDRWWLWRVGVVVSAKHKSVRVRWSDGEVWRYDGAHKHFLEVANY